MKKVSAFILSAFMAATPLYATAKMYIGAEFNNSSVSKGENSYTVFGENKGDKSETFRIISAATENNSVTNMKESETITVAPGSSFKREGSIVVPDTSDLGNTGISLYFRSGASGNNPIAQSVVQSGVSFTYEVGEAGQTSAGVYDGSGKLVRVLWGGKSESAGEKTGYWDGKDDLGNLMKSGNYEIKVLSNNVSYTLDATVGNNGEILANPNERMSNYDIISDMALFGNTMYYAEQYTEGLTACRSFNTDNPHRVAGYMANTHSAPNLRVATDGTYVYWMAIQTTPTIETQSDGTKKTTSSTREAFIYAQDIASNKLVTFEAGRPTYNFWGTSVMYSAIGVMQYGTVSAMQNIYTVGSDGYGDLAVQKNGNFLAAIYGNCGTVRIMNKRTGATVCDNAIDSPKAIAFDGDEKLYVAYSGSDGYKIERFVINTDGTLTADKTAPASVSFAEAISLAVSPDNTKLTVAYGKDVNRVVSYNINDWSTAWSYGSGESYKTDPAVYDNKLLFNDSADVLDSYTFLEYQGNGKIWIGDVGNGRAHRLNIEGAAPAVEDTIYHNRKSYPISVDANAPSRVFLGFYEYEIDYTKSGQSSWKPKKNWIYQAAVLSSNTGIAMESVTTLANGRTYMRAIEKASGKYKIYELCDKTIRDTGIDVSDSYAMYDGSFALHSTRNGDVNGVLCKCLYEREITGFTEDNNPIWGEETLIAYEPTSKSPQFDAKSTVTANGLIPELSVTVNSQRSDTDPMDYRLKASNAKPENMKEGYVWQTAAATMKNYNFDFPRTGEFEIGGRTWNTVHYQPQIYGNNIIFVYTGEGYKQKQTDIIYHYDDSGLLVGVFGEAMQQQSEYGKYGQELVNGNGFVWNIVYPDGKDADTAYLYQGGEARLSGAVRFKISGLRSINKQSIPVTLTASGRNGLLCELYSGTQYVNTNVVKKEAVEMVAMPSLSGVTGDYGVRFIGSITKPEGSDKKVKILVYSDGEATLKIGGKTMAKGSGYIGCLAEMEDNKAYGLSLNITGGSVAKLLYEKNGVITNYPLSALYTENIQDEASYKEVNLLDGIPTDKEITENSFGWSIGDFLASEISSKSVKTNVMKYDAKSPDLYIAAGLKRGESYEIKRSLGEPIANLKEWKIDAEVMFIGELGGWEGGTVQGTIRGQQERYMDILDKNGKVIARVSTENDYAIYGNGEKVYGATVPSGYSGTDARYKHEFTAFNPLSISCTEGSVTISYMTGSVSVPVYENGADWKNPAYIRISGKKQSYKSPYAAEFTTVFGSLSYSQNAESNAFTVTFYDADRKTVLKRETVRSGRSATAPSAEKEGYILSWSTAFDNISSNLSVYAVYTPDLREHTVKFYGEDKVLIAEVKAVYGTAANAPTVTKDKYTFDGWYDESGNAVDLSRITKDISLYAKFKKTGKVTESFENLTIDYSGKTVSGSEFEIVLSDNMFGTNSKDGEKVVSVKEVSGYDGEVSKALFVNPYTSVLGEEVGIKFDPIRTGKAKISFDYKITDYARSFGFNYFGSLKNAESGKTAACLTEIYSFGTQNPFDKSYTGAVIRVDKETDENGKYTNYDVVSKDKTWHTISYEIDMDSKTYTIISDGKEVGTYSMFDSDILSVDTLWFKGNSYAASTNTGRYYLDNIEVEYLN